MMGRDSMGGVGGSSREGEGEGKVKSKETSAARLLNVSIWEYLVGVDVVKMWVCVLTLT